MNTITKTDPVQAASTWLDQWGDKVRMDGDAWFPLYYPVFDKDGGIIEGKREFTGEIEMRGILYGDEESNTACIRLDGAGEDLTEAICDMYNHAADHINALIAECERLRAQIGTPKSHLLNLLKDEQMKTAELQIRIMQMAARPPKSLTLCDERGNVLANYQVADKVGKS